MALLNSSWPPGPAWPSPWLMCAPASCHHLLIYSLRLTSRTPLRDEGDGLRGMRQRPWAAGQAGEQPLREREKCRELSTAHTEQQLAPLGHAERPTAPAEDAVQEKKALASGAGLLRQWARMAAPVPGCHEHAADAGQRWPCARKSGRGAGALPVPALAEVVQLELAARMRTLSRLLVVSSLLDVLTPGLLGCVQWRGVCLTLFSVSRRCLLCCSLGACAGTACCAACSALESSSCSVLSLLWCRACILFCQSG